MELLTETEFDEYKETFTSSSDKAFTDENADTVDINTAINACVYIYMKAMRSYV